MLTYLASQLWSNKISQLKTSSVSTKLALFTSIPCPCAMNVHPLRDSSILTVPKMNLNQYGLKSFNSYGVKMWNPLPISYEADISLDELKYWPNQGKVRKVNALFVSFTHAEIYHFTWMSVRMCIYCTNEHIFVCMYMCTCINVRVYMCIYTFISYLKTYLCELCVLSIF